MRLDVDDAVAPTQLGDLAWDRGQIDRAIELWLEAGRRDPFDALAHARLGEAYARQEQRDLALAELKDAERFAADDPAIELILHRAFDALREVVPALDHGYKYRALARRLGGNPAMVRQVEMRLRELQASLAPRPVKAAAPRSYTESGLAAALRERLTADDLALVVDPMAISPAMAQVARNETRTAKGDAAKARKLYQILARRVETGPGGSRTAREVFDVWNRPDVSLRCQEYARFYVAMARAAGLQAFFTLVDRDARGKLVAHACAAVFIQGEAWLADPSYHQFGIAHRGFAVLDDLQAVAAYLHQQAGDLPRMRVAVKLQPDSAMAQFNLATTLMAAAQWDEARQVMRTATGLESDSWMARCALGIFAGCQGRWPQAETILLAALEANPEASKARFFLAEVRREQGRLREARADYRRYLRHELELDATFAPRARRAIAQINEILADE
jgi:tetratricopeptide (TPR) repeat protein